MLAALPFILAAGASWTTESPAATTARLDAARLPYEQCVADAVAARPVGEAADSSTRVAAALCRDREERLRAEYVDSPYGFTGGARDVSRLMDLARQRGEDDGLRPARHKRKRPPG